jgi:hypothetical protein
MPGKSAHSKTVLRYFILIKCLRILARLSWLVCSMKIVLFRSRSLWITSLSWRMNGPSAPPRQHRSSWDALKIRIVWLTRNESAII